MSFTRDDVLRMNKNELSALLDKSSIQHDRVTDINEMLEMYLNYMDETCSESVEDSAMSTGRTYTRDKVLRMNVMEISELLDQRNIEYENVETLEEMQDLYLMHINPPNSTQEQDPSNLAVMVEMLEKDQKKRADLVEIYDMLIAFFESNNKALDPIKSIMEITSKKFEETLTANKDKLCINECPIVIAGETSAGKSTLLNLLLGTKILPHSVLGTTALLFHIHNCDEKRLEIHLDNNEIVTVTAESDEELKVKLKPYVTAGDTQTQSKCTKVDVYWPIPMLHNQVTIVDTPGIGENDQLTDLLLTYLPNAFAFIYVINASNSGGVQDDYLLRILNKQAEWALNDLPNAIDYESTIFVCNKWDKIEAEEEVIVWEYITNRLNNLLPNFPTEHILRMSATLAQRNRENGLGLTPEYTNFLRSIEKLVAQSTTAKRRKYFMWIRSFLKNLQSILVSSINNADKVKYEKEKLKTDVLARLAKLSQDAHEIKLRLLREAEHECVDIVHKLWRHVQDKDVRESILSWEDHDIPDVQFDDFMLTKHVAKQKIQSRIRDVLINWERYNHIIENATDRLRSIFISECELLTTESERIKAIIEGSDERKIEEEESTTCHQENFETPLAYKVAIGVTSTILFPLALATAILVLPVAVGITVHDRIQNLRQLANFMKNKAKYMREWAQEVIESSLTKANVEQHVNKDYFGAMEKEIKRIFTCFIPNQIAADKELIHNICDDERTSQDILMEIKPLHIQVRLIQAKLQMYELVDLKEKNISALELIVDGSFYNIYKAKWTNSDNMEEDVAVKIIPQKLDGDSFLERFDELSMIKKIQHTHIVKVHDICCSTQDNDDKKLAIVQELCEGNLEDIVFKNEKLQCCKFSDTNRDEAFSFYLSMAIGVSEGLAKIHQLGYLHGDLKLSNVLVKNKTAKLSGEFLTKSKVLATERFAETGQAEQCTSSSDKYKFGILLWELWYGRHAYTIAGCTSATMVDSPEVKTDLCLRFTDRYCPPDVLQDLIIQFCTQEDTSQLITANEVFCRLKK